MNCTLYFIIAIVVVVVVIHIQRHSCGIYAKPRARKNKMKFFQASTSRSNVHFIVPMELWSCKQTHTPTTTVIHPQPANRKNSIRFSASIFRIRTICSHEIHTQSQIIVFGAVCMAAHDRRVYGRRCTKYTCQWACALCCIVCRPAYTLMLLVITRVHTPQRRTHIYAAHA